MEKPSIKKLRSDLKHSDRLVGELTREVEFLRHSQQCRTAWLDQAKREANYPQNTSFDIVWADALKALLAEQKRALESRKDEFFPPVNIKPPMPPVKPPRPELSAELLKRLSECPMTGMMVDEGKA